MLDVSLGRFRSALCNGSSRRDFLRVGALAPFGLALPQLLAAQAAQAADAKAGGGASDAPARKVRAKSILLVYLGGGISHHDTFDMKLDAPDDVKGKYTSIPSSVKGLHVSEKLPKMAKLMDKDDPECPIREAVIAPLIGSPAPCQRPRSASCESRPANTRASRRHRP